MSGERKLLVMERCIFFFGDTIKNAVVLICEPSALSETIAEMRLTGTLSHTFKLKYSAAYSSCHFQCHIFHLYRASCSPNLQLRHVTPVACAPQYAFLLLSIIASTVLSFCLSPSLVYCVPYITLDYSPILTVSDFRQPWNFYATKQT